MITKEELRNLTGLSDLEIDDDRLDQIILDAENLVEACTGQSWSTSDSEYSRIQTVTRLLAASLIYEGLPSTPETEKKAERYHEKALRMFDVMRGLETGLRVL